MYGADRLVRLEMAQAGPLASGRPYEDDRLNKRPLNAGVTQ
jgi:hypothetical protein